MSWKFQKGLNQYFSKGKQTQWLTKSSKHFLNEEVWQAAYINTCKKCLELDGTISSEWPEVPPLHKNCRCELTPVGNVLLNELQTRINAIGDVLRSKWKL